MDAVESLGVGSGQSMGVEGPWVITRVEEWLWVWRANSVWVGGKDNSMSMPMQMQTGAEGDVMAPDERGGEGLRGSERAWDRKAKIDGSHF